MEVINFSREVARGLPQYDANLFRSASERVAAGRSDGETNSGMAFGGIKAWLLAVIVGLVAALGSSAVEIPATELALRSAAETGGQIVITNSGVIDLSQPIVVTQPTSISAAEGQMVILSGGQQSRIFEVSGEGALALDALTLAAGRGNRGGAILSDGGAVTARACVFRDNLAIGMAASGSDATGESGSGGAVHSAGPLVFTDCLFTNNHALGGAGDRQANGTARNGGHASGGAITSARSLLASNCVFLCNGAQGGPGGNVASNAPTAIGGNGGAAIGGAISLMSMAAIRSCVFSNNTAEGGTAGFGSGAGGPAGGGAVAIESGSVTFCLAQFIANSAIGAPGAPGFASGDGGAGAESTGSAVYLDHGEAVVDRCAMIRNVLIGGEGAPGSDALPEPVEEPGPAGRGGAGGGVNGTICNIGRMTLSACTFAGNVLRGGAGGSGGNGVVPGRGGEGGHAFGGGLCEMGVATLRNCTVASNACLGGAGGSAGLNTNAPVQAAGGNGGSAGAAAVWLDMEENTASIESCTLAGNMAEPGSGGAGEPTGQPGYFQGLNVGSMGMAHLRNTICASDGSANQNVGMIMDMGGNLCSDGSCQFTERSSLNEADPRLLPLTENGGPTPTMALSRGSRALNRSLRNSAPPVDQRGCIRSGARRDVGAVEAHARAGLIIAGTVSDGTNGLAGVLVKAGELSTESDATGYFEIFGAPRGRRLVSATRPGTTNVLSRRITVRRDMPALNLQF